MVNNEQTRLNITNNLLGGFFNITSIPALTDTSININDLSYTSMLNQPLVSPDPRGDNIATAQNYLINASGLALPWGKPDSNFHGNPQQINNYTKVYKTTTAVQTYNLFALAKLYQDSQTNTTDWGLRKQLITQSTSSAWFGYVINQDLGWVIRQILLYISQNYVLSDQLVQLNRQIAATLAMTNTLLITNNYLQASNLRDSAEGINNNIVPATPPTPPE